MTKDCAACGKAVTFPPSRLSKTGNIYCGRECYQTTFAARTIRESTRALLSAAGARSHGQIDRTPNVACAKCGKRFYKRPCEMTTTLNFCCLAHRLGVSIHADAVAKRRVLKTRHCAVCGRPFMPHSGRGRDPKHCSSRCHGISVRKPTIAKNGYLLVLRPEHPRADHYGYVREHLLVAELSLGRSLKPKEVIHHINGNKADNRPENIRVVPTHAEHMALHRRERAAQRAADRATRPASRS